MEPILTKISPVVCNKASGFSTCFPCLPWYYIGKGIISVLFPHWALLVLVIGLGMYQYIGMGCKPSSSSSYYKGDLSTIDSLTCTCSWSLFFLSWYNLALLMQGTEYYDGKGKRYVDFPITDILQMMGRAGRPQYDQHGKAVILVHEPKKSFYKKVEIRS